VPYQRTGSKSLVTNPRSMAYRLPSLVVVLPCRWVNGRRLIPGEGMFQTAASSAMDTVSTLIGTTVREANAHSCVPWVLTAIRDCLSVARRAAIPSSGSLEV